MIDEEPLIEDTINEISYHNKVLEEAPPLPSKQASAGEVKNHIYHKPPLKDKHTEYGAKRVPQTLKAKTKMSVAAYESIKKPKTFAPGASSRISETASANKISL